MSNQQSPSEYTKDKKGRFAPGNKGGPGRPKKVTELAYLEQFQSALPPEDFAKVVVKPLRRRARKGDVKAAQILMEQAMGKPTQRVVLETPQVDALAKLQELMKGSGVEIDYEVSDE